jgi:hypothetical protein
MPPRCKVCGQHHGLFRACEQGDIDAYNAQVRDAAPLLLESVELFVSYHSGHCCLDAQLSALMSMGREAIAKAKGDV